jgi:hypothetical protein
VLGAEAILREYKYSVECVVTDNDRSLLGHTETGLGNSRGNKKRLNKQTEGISVIGP